MVLESLCAHESLFGGRYNQPRTHRHRAQPISRRQWKSPTLYRSLDLFHYCVHKNHSLVYILSQMNIVHALHTSFLYKYILILSFHLTQMLPNVLVERSASCFVTRSPGQEADNLDVFRGFSPSLQVHIGIIRTIRPRPLPCTSFPNHCSLIRHHNRERR
jgi:hypothetical protein